MTAAGGLQHDTTVRSQQGGGGGQKFDRVEDVLDDLAGNDDIEARIPEIYFQEHLPVNLKTQVARVFGLAVSRLHAGNGCEAGRSGAAQEVSRATANFKQAVTGDQPPEFFCPQAEAPCPR